MALADFCLCTVLSEMSAVLCAVLCADPPLPHHELCGILKYFFLHDLERNKGFQNICTSGLDTDR